MDGATRAAAGLILAAMGAAGWLALSVPFGFGLFDAGAVGVLVGMVVAGAGALAAPQRGPGTLAGGFGIAAAGGALLVASAFVGFNLYSLGALVIGFMMLQAAWFAVLWSSEGGDPTGRRVGGMRLSLTVAAIGAASFAVVNLTDGNTIWLLPNGAAAVGFALAAQSLGAPPATPARAEAARGEGAG